MPTVAAASSRRRRSGHTDTTSPSAASSISSTPGDSTISGGQTRVERSARCRSPQNVDVSGAMNHPCQGGENSFARSALRRAAGTVSTTLKYGLLRARATSAKAVAPAASAASAPAAAGRGPPPPRQRQPQGPERGYPEHGVPERDADGEPER